MLDALGKKKKNETTLSYVMFSIPKSEASSFVEVDVVKAGEVGAPLLKRYLRWYLRAAFADCRDCVSPMEREWKEAHQAEQRA